MKYVERLQNDITRITEFDTKIAEKIEELKEMLESLDFGGLTSDDDSKTVTAHKNRKLKVIDRVVNKFKKEVELYIVGGAE